MGGVDVFDRDNGGLDVQWEDHPRARPDGSRVVVDADVGVGAFEVHHDRSDRFSDHHGPIRDRFDDGGTDRNEGCTTAGGRA
jgi:hypothetical protein